MFDIIALGELIIDLTPAGCNENGKLLFERNAGGAPANVLVAAAKLGSKAAFIGKVGNDSFGVFLKNSLIQSGVEAGCILTSCDTPTMLAVVQLDEAGDRSFSFYGAPGADTKLTAEELPKDIIRSTSIFHFGSASLAAEPSRSATIRAVEYAKSSGAIISYDPNYRAMLWSSETEAVSEINRTLPLADIVKVSGEELYLLTGEIEPSRGARILQGYGIKLVLVTLGAEGAYYLYDLYEGCLPTYAVNTVDTTGAGDAFAGAVLHRLSHMQKDTFSNMKKSELEDVIAFANAAGALATTATGAAAAMPDISAIERCISETPLL
jgi:fructokinase